MRLRRSQPEGVWPKVPPPLSAAESQAREEFMQLWHEQLPGRYSALEDFNQGYVARLPHRSGIKTLEIGAGLGGHLPYERLSDQDYYCLEYRASFCETLRRKIEPSHVLCADIQDQVPQPDHFFDRIVAIHTLEHLRDLPRAVSEIRRLLKADGILDIVLPCEGGWMYGLARRISSQRLFEKTFHMSYIPIILNEHVNNLSEILALLDKHFIIDTSRFFPFRIPIYQLNLCAGLRLRPK